MRAPAFDPSAPLPSPPDPWTGSTMPSVRSGPPWHMTDMIAAEPHLARRILGALAADGSPAATLAGAVADTVGRGRSTVLTGCGTSEHAAQGAAEILRRAAAEAGLGAGAGRIQAEQALELALDPVRGGLLIAVSHEGGSAATNAALEAGAAAGCRTALITAAAGSPGARLADIAVASGEMDQSWCHTVGYVAPLVATAAVAGHLAGRPPDADAVAALMTSAGDAVARAVDGLAERIAGSSRLLVLASGIDRPAGRELVLKIEEAAWVPSAYRDLETFLHGHLPATDEDTGVVLVLTDTAARVERAARASQALAAARVVGIRAGAIVAAGADPMIDADLTPAGRLVVPDADGVFAPVASLLASAIALQVLTERIARARGTNPDAIRRDDSRYREAAEAAGG